MNARGTVKCINDTCSTLYALGLLFTYKSAICRHEDGLDIVTWAGPGRATADRFGSLEQYWDWVKEGAFTCLLSDLSLIRASYFCIDSQIVGHNLLYWPCPVEFKIRPESLEDVCDGFLMCLESVKAASEVCDLTMRTPMRFDFDPEGEDEGHPLVHLHLQFEETRLHVQQGLHFSAFIKKVFRTFYSDEWAKHRELRDLHEQDFEQADPKHEIQPHCLQMAWC